MAKKKIEHQPPDVIAMVLADAVLHDIVSGKFYINGTYSVIACPQFPMFFPVIAAYIAITGGRGKIPIQFRLVDVDESREPIFESQGELDFSDPLQVVETVFAAKGVVFPEPGEYCLQIFSADHPLRERRLQVIPISGREPADDGDKGE